MTKLRRWGLEAKIMSAERLSFGALFAAAFLLAVSPARADFFPILMPDPTYLGSTSLIPITAPNGSSVSSITDGTQTVTIHATSVAHTVPAGGWATWDAPPFAETATPRVLSDYSSRYLVLTLSSPVSVFGLEAEPNPFNVHCIAATFYSGTSQIGAITRNVNGQAGSLLLAAATNGSPITGVIISGGGANFGLAEVRYSATFYHPIAHSIHGHVDVGRGLHGQVQEQHQGTHGHHLLAVCTTPLHLFPGPGPGPGPGFTPVSTGNNGRPLTGETSEGLSSDGAVAVGPTFVAARNEDGTINGDPTAQNEPRLAARRGTILQLFGSAAGLSVRDERGSALVGDASLFMPPAAGKPLYRTSSLPEVLVGGVPAKVLFSGLAPGLTGVWQVNFVVPEWAPVGPEVPLSISYEGATLRSAPIALE